MTISMSFENVYNRVSLKFKKIYARMCEHKIYQVNKTYRALVWMIVVLLQTCVSTPMFLFVGVF